MGGGRGGGAYALAKRFAGYDPFLFIIKKTMPLAQERYDFTEFFFFTIYFLKRFLILQYTIIYPDGQSVSSSMRVEPFAVLLWALSNVLAHTATGDPVRRTGIPQQWYLHGTVRQGSVRFKVRFNLIEDASAPSLFPSSCIIYLRIRCWKDTFSLRVSGWWLVCG